MHSRSLLTASVGAALLLVLLVLVAAPATASAAESGELRQPPHPKHADASSALGKAQVYNVTIWDYQLKAKPCDDNVATIQTTRLSGKCISNGASNCMYIVEGSDFWGRTVTRKCWYSDCYGKPVQVVDMGSCGACEQYGNGQYSKVTCTKVN